MELKCDHMNILKTSPYILNKTNEHIQDWNNMTVNDVEDNKLSIYHF